jgi:hypothetical protein
MSAGFHAGLNSEARDWRITYKQPFLATSQESAKQESSSRRQRQPNSERHTRTVNLPLLPAENCHGAYGHQKSSSENSLCPALAAMMRLALLVGGLLNGALRPAAGKGRGRARWSSLAVRALDSELCTIPRVPAAQVSPERFEREFRGQRPVILQGLSRDERWTIHRRWQKKELLAKYGERMVAVRRQGDAADQQRQNNGLGGTLQITLAEYVAQQFDAAPVPASAALNSKALEDVTYQFDRTFMNVSAPEMKRDFHTPRHFAGLTSDAKQDPLFFLGPRGSGVGFHRHGEAWNVVAHGRKRWFLYPPEWRSDLLGVNPDQALDGLGWLRTFYPQVQSTDAAPMECIQEAGDVAYMPELWHHATLNVQDTVGVAHNHLPSLSGTIRVAPEQFHWAVAPTQVLGGDAMAAAVTRRESLCPDAVSSANRAALSAPCLEAQVSCAIGLLEDYIWCGENTVGVVQVSALAPNTVETARRGLAVLRSVTCDDDASPPSQPISSSVSTGEEENIALRAAWARGAFVLGLALLGPGPLQDEKQGSMAVLAAIDDVSDVHAAAR